MGQIIFDSVRKVYGDETVAVDDFDLTVEDGEFLTLVGPSGSGKSTTLRMLAGLEDVTEGQIRIDDEVVNLMPPRERDIAMVFQSYALYPHLTVRENISFGLKRSTDLSSEEISERVENVADLLGIPELLDNKPKQLSGGQQQRVATGRAIVREPGVFLFDEPLSNLDAKLRKRMRTELNRIQQELDTTTIYVTHDQEEAMTMSDRIAILHQGKMQQVGTPREVYDHPLNLFVAQFIGSPSMDLFDGAIRESGTDLRFESEDIDFSLSESLAQRVRSTDAVGEEVTCGIRPEDLYVTDDPDEAFFDATVDLVEPVGRDNLLYFTFPENEGNEEEYVIFVDPELNPDVGTRLSFGFNEEDIHLFERASGRNIRYDQQETHQGLTPIQSG